MMTSSGKLKNSLKGTMLHVRIWKHFTFRQSDQHGIWDQNLAWELTEEQSKDIEQIQRRLMKIICPEKTYEQALIECGMETLENRREKMCVKLINDMKVLKADFHSVQNVARSTFSERFLLNYKQSSGTNLISCGWLNTFKKKALAKDRSHDILHWMEICLYT